MTPPTLPRLRAAAALAAALALPALPAAARAQFAVYTDLAAFLAATSGAGTDTFDDLAQGPLATPLARAAGPFAYTVAASTTELFGAGQGPDGWLTANTATDVLTFSGFGPGVRGVGGFFFGTDLAGAARPAATITLRATNAGGTTTRTLVDPAVTTFLGFVSAGDIIALEVEVAAQPSATDPTFPTVGGFVAAGPAAVVPEPSALWLVGGGLLIGGIGRRQLRRPA